MKKIVSIFLGIVMLVGICTASSIAYAEEPILNEYNDLTKWTNLPGYTYVGSTNDTKTNHPARVSLTKDGINYVDNGYYFVGNQNFSGLVYNQPLLLDGLTIELKINKVSYSAATGYDGWLGIGLMDRKNIWDAASTSNALGGVNLLWLEQQRSIRVDINEVAKSSDGSINKGFYETYQSASVAVPRTEGAVIKMKYKKTSNGSYDVFMNNTRIATGFQYSSTYLNDGKAYLGFSCSTSNAIETAFTITKINGVSLGSGIDDGDTEQITPQKEVKLLEEIASSLDGKISEVTQKDEDRLLNYLDVLNNLSADAKELLSNQDLDYYQKFYPTLTPLNAYIKYLRVDLVEASLDKIYTEVSANQTTNFIAAYKLLPSEASNITLSDEPNFVKAQKIFNSFIDKSKQHKDYIVWEKYISDAAKTIREIKTTQLNAKINSVDINGISNENFSTYIAAVETLYQCIEEYNALTVDEKLGITEKGKLDNMVLSLQTLINSPTFTNQSAINIASAKAKIKALPQNGLVSLYFEPQIDSAYKFYSQTLTKQERSLIEESCVNSLYQKLAVIAEIYIDALPSVENITALSDIELNIAKQAFNKLGDFKSLVADSKKEKLQNSLLKYDIVTKPIYFVSSAKDLVVKQNQQLKEDLLALVQNPNSLKFEFSTTAGKIEDGYLICEFNDVKNTEITVTLSATSQQNIDKPVFDEQTSSIVLKINVLPSSEKKGCGSAASSVISVIIVSLAALLIFKIKR